MTLISDLESEVKARKERLALLNRDQDLDTTRIAELQREAERIQATIRGRAGDIGRELETIQSLEDALAHLVTAIEHDGVTLVEADPELPAAPSHAPAPTPEPRSKHSGGGGRFRRDPLTVSTKNPSANVRTQPNRAKRQMLTDGPANIDTSKISPTLRERAEFLAEVMDDHGDEISQYDLAVRIADLLHCKQSTAQPITSDALMVLQAERRVLYTGRKAPTPRSKRLTSPIWKLVSQTTPPELASAGLGIHEDDFEGRTTTPPRQATTGFIREEKGGFETNRRKH